MSLAHLQHQPWFSPVGRFSGLLPNHPAVTHIQNMRDFPGSPVVKTQPFNADGVGSVPGRGTKVPRALWPESQNAKQKFMSQSLFLIEMAKKKKKKKEGSLSLIVLSAQLRWSQEEIPAVLAVNADLRDFCSLCA